MKKSYIIIPVILIATVTFFIVNRDTPLEKVAKYIKRGDVLFAEGEYKKARLEYKNAAKITPADVEVEYRWGLVDEAEGDIRSATVAFMQAEQQDPHFHKAKLKMAHYHTMGENLEEAQKRIDFVLAEAPDNAQAHAIQAAILLRKKDFIEAEKEARIALAKEPSNIVAIAALTGTYVAQEDIEKAGQTLNEGIKNNPKNTSLLLLKAKIYENPLNMEKINEIYQAIFILEPKKSHFRLYLTNTYISVKKLDEAEKILRQAIKDIPKDWKLKRSLINFLNQNRDLEAVEKEINLLTKKYPKHNEIYLWLSDIYTAKNKTEKSVAILKKVISKGNADKHSLNAKTALAQINFIKGDKKSAKKTADEVLKISSRNPEALYIRASIAADNGDYKAAVTDLRRVIHDKPKGRNALKLLSEVFLLQGHNNLAIETLNQLIDFDPNNVQSLVRLSQLYYLNGNTKHALRILNDVNENHPQYAIGWENSVRLAIKMNDVAAAKSAIKNLKTFKDQEIVTTFLQGEIAALTKKDDEAFLNYSTVIETDPDSAMAEHALYSLVKTHSKADELEMVAKYIASIKTDSPYVSTILGESYMKIGKTDMAIIEFEKAIANNSTKQSPYVNRAKIYLNKKKYDEAITILKAASKKIPTEINAPMMEAAILLTLKRYKEALEIYDNILSNHPKVTVAANNMASVIADHQYTDPKMLEKAYKAAKRFRRSNNPLFLDTLGWVHYRKGDFRKAVEALQKSIELNPKPSQETRYHYGAALWKNGNTKQAKTELTSAVKEGANYLELNEAKKILKQINNSKQ